MTVAVPTAVRPLPLEQALDESGGLALVGPVQRDGRRQGVPVPQRMRPWPAGDKRRVARALHLVEPAQDGAQLVVRSALFRRDPELNQRGQPPEGTLPLGVNVLRPRGQQRTSYGSIGECRARRDNIRIAGWLAQNVCQGEAAHGWLVGSEQPLDTRILVRDSHWPARLASTEI